MSTWKNGISYLNKFEEYLLLEHKGTHSEHKELIYVSEINEDLLIDFEIPLPCQEENNDSKQDT